MVTDRIRNKESRRKSVEAVPSESNTFVSEKQEMWGRSQTRNSHQQNNDNPKGRSKSQKRNMKCFYCQKIGHVKRECRLWKREQAKENGDAQKNDNQDTTAIVNGDINIVYDESTMNLTCHTCDWVIDLGASLHVTVHHDYFTSYVNSDYDHVRIGNDVASKIVSI